MKRQDLAQGTLIVCFFFLGWTLVVKNVPAPSTATNWPGYNPFAIRGSGYGKMLSRFSEKDVDRAWHIGLEGSGHSDSSTWQGRYRLLKSTRNSSVPLSASHLQHIRNDIRRKLYQAFLLDPTNYTTYDALHFFLTAMSDIPEETLFSEIAATAFLVWEVAAREEEDPEPWLTAAVAMMNLDLEFNNTPIPSLSKPELHHRIKDALRSFDRLRNDSLADGRWSELSDQRRAEIETRRNFLGKYAERL
jgi:hypothetical protein